jgi:hypothetical protein
LHVLPHSIRRPVLVLASCLSGAAAAAVPALAASPAPSVHTNRGCYLVGQRVIVRGSGFAASRLFDVAIDGVDFGQSMTDATGGFSSPLIPGGLGAGQPQHVDHLDASDGSSSAGAVFTVSRRAGGRILATSGNPPTLRAPFEVWGFALGGSRPTVYLHYVSLAGQVRMTSTLGVAGGQCGYLRTRSRRVFPFSPALGRWTLQLDTSRTYTRRPSGPVARVQIQIQ